jgi:hypothetical protein
VLRPRTWRSPTYCRPVPTPSHAGFGKVVGGFIVYVVVARGAYFVPGGISLDGGWRLALSFGAVPAALTAYFRWRFMESDIYRQRMLGETVAPASASSESTSELQRADSAASTSSVSPMVVVATRPTWREMVWLQAQMVVSARGGEEEEEEAPPL